MVIDAGTVVEASLEVSDTTRPPVGAGSFNVTVAVEEAPPTSEVGLNATPETPGVVTAKVAVTGVPSADAVIVVVVLAATAKVVTVKVPVELPLGIVTDAGTVPAAVLLEVKLTTAPPVGAGSFKVMVPVADVPPATDVGLTLTLLTN